MKILGQQCLFNYESLEEVNQRIKKHELENTTCFSVPFPRKNFELTDLHGKYHSWDFNHKLLLRTWFLFLPPQILKSAFKL